MFKMFKYDMQCTYWKIEEGIESIENVCNKETC